ncbi:MAG: hypothetical protein VKK59_05890, partial [Vampirovibrionales bacterium]|nr:hypothetical protein [Vampirovibrionales bacterium]
MRFFSGVVHTRTLITMGAWTSLLLWAVLPMAPAYAASYEPYWRQLSGELLAMKQWHDHLAQGVATEWTSPTYETVERDAIKAQAEVLDVQVTLSRVNQLRLTVDRLWAVMPPPTSLYGGPAKPLQTQQLLVDLARVSKAMDAIAQQMQASQFQPPYVANVVPASWPAVRSSLLKTL